MSPHQMPAIDVLMSEIDRMLTATAPSIFRCWVSKDRTGTYLWPTRPYFDDELQVFSGGEMCAVADETLFLHLVTPSCIRIEAPVSFGGKDDA